MNARPINSDLICASVDDAAALAYGLLWLAPTDRRDPAGRLASDARIALGNALGMAGKKRGIQAAQDFMAKHNIRRPHHEL